MALPDLFKQFESATSDVIAKKEAMDAAQAKASSAASAYNEAVAKAQGLQETLQAELAKIMPQSGSRVRQS